MLVRASIEELLKPSWVIFYLQILYGKLERVHITCERDLNAFRSVDILDHLGEVRDVVPSPDSVQKDYLLPVRTLDHDFDLGKVKRKILSLVWSHAVILQNIVHDSGLTLSLAILGIFSFSLRLKPRVRVFELLWNRLHFWY